MADGFSVKTWWRTTSREMQRIEKSVDRATMYAVRQTGRRVKQEAKREAPVLKGGISRKEFRAGWEAGRFSAGGKTPPIKGLLRVSIHSSKRLHQDGRGGYAVRVAPRGERVHFYSGQMESMYGYMRKAYERIAPELREVAADAWRKASRGRR